MRLSILFTKRSYHSSSLCLWHCIPSPALFSRHPSLVLSPSASSTRALPSRGKRTTVGLFFPTIKASDCSGSHRTAWLFIKKRTQALRNHQLKGEDGKKHFVSQDTTLSLEELDCCHTKKLEANGCTPEMKILDPEIPNQSSKRVSFRKN